jgi:type I restriction enzyme S subunit
MEHAMFIDVVPIIYRRIDTAAFRKTREQWGGLSNMAGGFPLSINGIEFLTSEHLYQACRFPHRPELQQLIIIQRSPMAAKLKARRFGASSRADWMDVRVSIMRWCVRVKLAQHWAVFSTVLSSTGSLSIVEESHKDAFWGAKPQGDGTLVGCNVLGRLLEELRDEKPCPSANGRVSPPSIPDLMLCGEAIPTIQITQSSSDPVGRTQS